jgi:hypothetical protein
MSMYARLEVASKLVCKRITSHYIWWECNWADFWTTILGRNCIFIYGKD